MRVWRIARERYQGLDGEGARLNGGRWNSAGRAAIYTSETLALAALEYLVHVEPLLAPSDLVALEIDVPAGPRLGVRVDAGQIPDTNWRAFPAPEWEAQLGDLWLGEGEFLWLAVPSAIVPEEHNILINPRHPRMRDVRVVSTRAFGFDERLL